MDGSGKAVLDACVLVPATTRDLLLSTAHEGAFEPVWSGTVLEEVRRALTRVDTRAADPEASAARQVRAMAGAFPQAQVTDLDEILGGLRTNDPDDAHVLAAAVRTGADRVVTTNRFRDFHEPGTAELPPLARQAGVRLLSPDDFLLEEFEFNPGAVERALAAMVQRRTNPPIDRAEMLQSLSRQNFPQLVTAMLARHAARQSTQILRNLGAAQEPSPRVTKRLDEPTPRIIIGSPPRKPRKDR